MAKTTKKEAKSIAKTASKQMKSAVKSGSLKVSKGATMNLYAPKDEYGGYYKATVSTKGKVKPQFKKPSKSMKS